MKTKYDLRTVAYAMEWKALEPLIKELIAEYKDEPTFEHIEEGSPKDDDGHAITFKLDGEIVFFAMIGTGGRYLLRADKVLIRTAEEVERDEGIAQRLNIDMIEADAYYTNNQGYTTFYSKDKCEECGATTYYNTTAWLQGFDESVLLNKEKLESQHLNESYHDDEGWTQSGYYCNECEKPNEGAVL